MQNCLTWGGGGGYHDKKGEQNWGDLQKNFQKVFTDTKKIA